MCTVSNEYLCTRKSSVGLFDSYPVLGIWRPPEVTSGLVILSDFGVQCAGCAYLEGIYSN